MSIITMAGQGSRLNTSDSGGGGGGNAFFSDGFESGDFSHEEGGASWSTPTAGVTVQTTAPVTGLRSARFRYGPDADGGDSDAELPFELGGNYTEVWAKYDLIVPSNYYHRDQSDSNNNKGFLYLWSGDYGSPDGPGMGPNFWTGSIAGPGESRMKLYIWGPGLDAHLEPSVMAIEDEDKGKTVQIVCHYKYATAANNDGIAEIWKKRDGVWAKLMDIQDGAWYVSGQPGFERGYLFGWANSGFTDQTDLYVDNVVFSTTNDFGVS